MKKSRIVCVLAIIFAILLLTTSCVDLTMLGIGNGAHTAHVDANSDGKCDTCTASVPKKCTEHKDLDHDGLCDSNGCIAEVDFEHTDPDADGVCDGCGDEIECETHKDSNHDGKCDNPGCDGKVKISHTDLNHDGSCDSDECSKTGMKVTHIGYDDDGICDICGIDMNAVCIHTDENRDGKCDACREEIPGRITLVDEKGKTSFKFVIGKGLDATARLKINHLISELDALDVSVSINDGAEVQYEVLFGEVSKRDEKYLLDVHDYGTEGYTVQIIDTKIVVFAGSYNAYIKAIAALRENIFGITDDVLADGELKGVYLYPEDSILQPQRYDVELITLFGKDIRDFKIAIDRSNLDSQEAASALQRTIYENTGYWLEIADSSKTVTNAIFLNRVDKCGEGGFEAIFTENKIVFNSEYSTSLKKVPCDFFLSAIGGVSGALELDGDDGFTKNAHYVYYDDFGAVGDGKTNDADAIYEAHWFAYNGGHKKIIASSGKHYYIGEISAKQPIPIVCDVVWTGAEFTIDDRAEVITNEYRGSVFKVQGAVYTALSPSSSDFIKAINDAGGFKAAEMNSFDLGLGYKAMLVIKNYNHKNYIRNGINENGGVDQAEIIVIDEFGNIDPSTRFLFDYEHIGRVEVYRVDEDAVPMITVDGGKFTTVAYDERKTGYTGQRGITVNRSNAVIKNLEHYVVGEVDGLDGAGYPNFMDIDHAYNVLITDCVFTARKYYKGAKGQGQGTYDITSHYSVNVTWQRCTESNFYKIPGDPTSGRPASGTYWGINGGGHCKNVTYKECLLSRFDAHTGIMNAYIIDSIVGSVDVCGGGELHIINSTVYGASMLRLREDYGSFWHGDLLIKDVTMIAGDKSQTAYVFDIRWANWDFGYPTALPANIEIDGLRIEGVATKIALFPPKFMDGSENYAKEEFLEKQADGSYQTVINKNIMAPPQKITVRNNDTGRPFVFPEKTGFFENTEMIEIK